MFENSSIADLAAGRSTVRQRILALLLAEPGSRLHLRAIQRRAGTSPGTASRELTKLVSAGLIEREAEGESGLLPWLSLTVRDDAAFALDDRAHAPARFGGIARCRDHFLSPAPGRCDSP